MASSDGCCGAAGMTPPGPPGPPHQGTVCQHGAGLWACRGECGAGQEPALGMWPHPAHLVPPGPCWLAAHAGLTDSTLPSLGSDSVLCGGGAALSG